MFPLSFARLLKPHTLEHADRRPIGQECRGRRALQAVGELLSVEPCSVALQARLEGRPRAPARMLDLVLQGASTPPTRVAPVVLRDEFLVATGRDLTRLASNGDAHLILVPLELPSVVAVAYRTRTLADHGDAMTHRYCQVVFAVENPGRHGDGHTRHQLLDEDDGASPAIARASPDVEAQIHLLEVAMTRDGDSENARIEKHEPDQAHECPAAIIVELRPGGDQGMHERWIDFEIQHRQMAPLGGEEYGPGVSHPVLGAPDGPQPDENEAESRDVAEVPGLDVARDRRAGEHTDGGSGDQR